MFNMKTIAKYQIVFLAILMFIFILFFDLVLEIKSPGIKAAIAALLAAILMPRKKKIITQSGEKTQLTWIFLKKPIFLD